MQTYDERIKATHQRARQRKLITFSPDFLPAAEAPGEFAPMVAVAFKSTFTPALDEAMPAAARPFLTAVQVQERNRSPLPS